MRHSPAIELQAARRARELAELACPHWDIEGGPYAEQACCKELIEAQRLVTKLERDSRKNR